MTDGSGNMLRRGLEKYSRAIIQDVIAVSFMAAPGFDASQERLHVARTAIIFASVLSALLGVLYIRMTAATNELILVHARGCQ